MTGSGNLVAVVSRPGLAYPERSEAPFNPPNPVYEAVEAAFRGLGLDAARAGTPEWNPLGDLIRPGDRVIVKPNFVANKNFHEFLRGRSLECSSTHGSILRPVLDHACRAAGPGGQIRVVDAPVEGCDIESVISGLGVREVTAGLRKPGRNLEFLDLRTFRIIPRMALDDARFLGRSWNLGLLVRRPLPGDPLGYRVVDLRDRSFFHEVSERGPRLRFHRSHPRTPVPHHTAGRNEYSIPRTVLEADVVISLPKLKTHKKTGITVALKSCIGLTNEKYWLPHYTAGPPSAGDEYPSLPPLGERLEARLSRLGLPGDTSLVARAPRLERPRRLITEGSWQGNDTVWRTALDLTRILHYADRQGEIRDTVQRRHLTLVDGIVAGEGDGPLAARPRAAGIVIAGTDPVLVDLVSARAMGYNEQVMPMLTRAVGLLPSSHPGMLDLRVDGPPPQGRFDPPPSWPVLRENPAGLGELVERRER